MSIRISRNSEGNCINFIGSSNPAYWNACLSAVINSDDSNRIDVVNDIRSANDADTQYEFYAVNYTDFADKDGNAFADAQAAVDYINLEANVSGVSDTGADLTDVSVNFRLDETHTSIIMDNGAAFGVNTVKAVADADGTIHIHAIGAGAPSGSANPTDHKHYEKLIHTNVSVNGTAVAGGLQDVVNTLNELFTVGAFEAVVISDPYSTMISDVAGVDANGALAGNAVNPSNTDIAAGSSAHYNKAGWLSSDTIDQAGEYFSFDIRVEGIIGMGLVVDDAADINGNTTYGDPTKFCDGVTNSGYYGLQFGHFFHPSPNGPWTNYGANTGHVMGVGWSNATHKFSGSPEGADWLAGNPVKMRTGIDEMGFISIDYYDVSEATWITCARTNYPTVEGVKYKLGIKLCDSNARLASLPKIHLHTPLAPTMYFRYIESPDGVFNYPLFSTAEEAEYYDEITNGLAEGAGSSHTHTYTDDPTGTTWYMPEATHDASTYVHSSAPNGFTFNGTTVNWTEVTSLTNADLAPSAFSSLDYSYEEGTAVNFQLYPAGATFSQTVTISPSGSGMVYNSTTGYLQGTLTDVGADTTYTVTVTRANSYGSNVGTFEVVATNVAPVQTHDTPWTKALDFSGSSEHLKQVSSSTASNALRMNGLAQLAGANSDSSKTSNDTYSRPWATAVVFQVPNNNSNQHIWNSGEGTGTNADNMYLRITGANGELYFGWGREGVGYNELHILNIGGSYNQSTGQWYGVYIAHKGQRFNSSNATAANLVDAFDIRVMGTNDVIPVFDTVYTVADDVSDWTSTGVRMDRTVEGDFTIGGRGSNRSFHGKVASMVITTLRKNYTMPTDAEIKLMLTDPLKWEEDYKEGQAARYGYSGSNFSYSSSNSNSKYATQIWLMGDGTSDSYSNGIRNQVSPSDQNSTKMQLNSMVSNDIETVNIPGLT
jgi:hypothetical protein